DLATDEVDIRHVISLSMYRTGRASRRAESHGRLADPSRLPRTRWSRSAPWLLPADRRRKRRWPHRWPAPGVRLQSASQPAAKPPVLVPVARSSLIPRSSAGLNVLFLFFGVKCQGAASDANDSRQLVESQFAGERDGLVRSRSESDNSWRSAGLCHV